MATADAYRQPDNGAQVHRALWVYRAHIVVYASLAERTGCSDDDLAHLFSALTSMFGLDRSAARGVMASRRIVAFKHAAALGNAAAHRLFERVTVSRCFGGELYDPASEIVGNVPPAWRFADYDVGVDEAGLPEGVEVLHVL